MNSIHLYLFISFIIQIVSSFNIGQYMSHKIQARIY